MTNLFQDLQVLGLSPNQSQIYLALFRMGQAKAGEIIKKTGLHRNLVYVALQELTERKLVTTSKQKGITIYKVLASSRLLAEPHEKERIAKNVIEELGLLSKKSTSSQEIVVYEGIEEFRRFTEQTFASLKSRSVVKYLGISPRWHVLVGPELEKEIVAMQVEKEIRVKALAHTIAGEHDYVRNTKGLSEMRVNKLISSDTSGVEILDDRISIRSFVEPYFVVEIVHSALAKNYQNYFDFLWKQARN